MASATARLLQLSRKVITPSTPTPLALKTYKLSRFEQAFNHNYMLLAFFYDNNSILRDDQISQVLRSSLPKTLSCYYPFAGSLEEDGNSVYCNDRGATFVEAEIKCPMNTISNNKDVSMQNVVYPSGTPLGSSFYNDSLLVIQLSHFDCGGKAVSVCLSHKIADGASFSNFIRHWASVARQSGTVLLKQNIFNAQTSTVLQWLVNFDSYDSSVLANNICIFLSPPFNLSSGYATELGDEEHPQFDGASLFPPTNACHPFVHPYGESRPGITNRFVFDDSKIKQLKERAIKESGVESPTRVEVVSSLIYRNAIISATFKPSAITHVVNLRSLTKPRIPQAIGCFNTVFHISTDEPEDIKFGTLINEYRKGKENVNKKFNQMKTEEYFAATDKTFGEVCSMASQGTENIKQYDLYGCTSLCNYGLADIDFGWGKPVRASLGGNFPNNQICLLDECGGKGLEALVTLDEGVMSVFESNEEVVRYSSSSGII